ncbi:MAG: serine/threonine protein kinase, partial [Woeseiaceae bacterium]|nr:serine/threonine protein kinase [Woeseiaceae bacterium]
MEHKSDSNDPDPPASSAWEDQDRSSKEFDEAVTSELSVERFTEMAAFSADQAIPESADNEASERDANTTADDKPLASGQLLGDRFEIVALVHSGGMGHVYKAIDKRRHRRASEQVHVAIKMMRRSLAPRMDAQLALEREANKTQHLSHPNIVNVFDFDQHGDQFYLVMEWLEGESVNALLRRTSGQRLEPHFAWQIVEGIARGLQNAHSHNVVHADINPSNIFITETHEIKLLDFGVARYTNDPNYEDGSQPVWVTRTYASPEVLAGKTPTFEDDIFALGCIAYRLLSGTHPFGGSPSIDAQQAGVSVPRIPGLAQSQWRTLRRALSYDRADRPNSASVFYQQTEEPTVLRLLGDKLRGVSGRQWLMAGGFAAILLAGTLWLSRPGLDDVAPPAAETATADGGTALATGESPLAAGADAGLTDLLSRAAVAMDEQRLVAPEAANARTLYL